MTDEEAKIWSEGFTAGAKSVEARKGTAIKLGTAIIEVLYEVFEPVSEDD